MISHRVGFVIERCRTHLDNSGARNTEIDSILAGYTCAVIYAWFESEIVRAVSARASHGSDDQAIARFTQQAATRLVRSIKVSELKGLAAYFGEDSKQKFAEGCSDRAIGAWDSIVSNRHGLAHEDEAEGSIPSLGSLTFEDVERDLAYALKVLWSFRGALGFRGQPYNRFSMAPDTISFARGAPSPDLLPAEPVKEAASKALESDWKRALSYGTGVGHPGLREWVAERHGVSVDETMIVNGSLQGAVLFFQRGVREGVPVAVEQPTYDRTLLLLQQLGADLRPIGLEADGLDVDALEESISSAGAPRIAHVIPNSQNPAGCTLSTDKRRRLVELAGAHGFAIFEDDPYNDILFGGEAEPTMLSMDDNDAVVYACSFSKTVAPGVRVGYLVGPEKVIAELSKTANEQYISPNMLAESVVWELCTSGALERNVEAVNEALAERRDALATALDEHIPEASYVLPGGGYFLWATLNDDVDTTELQELAADEGVAVIKGEDFMIEGGKQSLRFSFASVPADDADEGIRRLAAALEKLRS